MPLLTRNQRGRLSLCPRGRPSRGLRVALGNLPWLGSPAIPVGNQYNLKKKKIQARVEKTTYDLILGHRK